MCACMCTNTLSDELAVSESWMDLYVTPSTPFTSLTPPDTLKKNPWDIEKPLTHVLSASPQQEPARVKQMNTRCERRNRLKEIHNLIR
jgi:hypothetical protein